MNLTARIEGDAVIVTASDGEDSVRKWALGAGDLPAKFIEIDGASTDRLVDMMIEALKQIPEPGSGKAFV